MKKKKLIREQQTAKILVSYEFHDQIIDPFGSISKAINYKTLARSYKLSAGNLKTMECFKKMSLMMSNKSQAMMWLDPKSENITCLDQTRYLEYVL